MAKVNRFQLLHGPYLAPKTRRDAKLFCEIRGTVVVGGYSDARISWPRVKKGGLPCLILCGALVQAVRRESSLAIAHHWGVNVVTVWKWRKALGVGPYNDGTLDLMRRHVAVRDDDRLERARVNASSLESIEKRTALLRGKPWKLSPAAKRRQLLAVRSAHDDAWRAKVSATHKANGHRPTKPLHRPWSAEEDALLMATNEPNDSVAKKLGRTRGGVALRRMVLGVPYLVEVDGQQLEARRKLLGLERRELGERARVSTVVIWKLETGRMRRVGREIWERVNRSMN